MEEQHFKDLHILIDILLLYLVKPAKSVEGNVDLRQRWQSVCQRNERVRVAVEQKFADSFGHVPLLHLTHHHRQRSLQKIAPIARNKRCSLHKITNFIGNPILTHE